VEVGPDRDVIPLPVRGTGPLMTSKKPATTPARFRAVAQQLEELRRCVERIALDPQWSAMEWRAICAPLIIQLPGARQLLASLNPVRVGLWPDTEWAARVRTAHDDVERRLLDVGFAMSAVTSDETSHPDAAISLTSDAQLLAAAARELHGLITSHHRAPPGAASFEAGMGNRDWPRSLDRGQRDEGVITEGLARQISTLADILRAVGDEARLMDASLDDTHGIASRVGRLVKYGILGPDDLRPASFYPDIYLQFEQIRADENDAYEVYADDLERQQKRRRKDLTIADADADKTAVAKRRRTYIAILFDFRTQISEIVDRLAS
jgi:hypothetical protein